MSNNNDLVVRAEKLWGRLTLPEENTFVSSAPVIALEGHNGAGKSTIAGLIRDHFNMKVHVGVPNVFLAGGLKYRMIAETNWQASALYFLSGVMEKIRELRELENNDGFHLIERSLWSTLSAHASEDPIRLAKIVAILREMGIGLCEPDYTIILNATFDHCYGRIQLKENEEEKKLDALLTHDIYYQKEAVFYRWLGAQRKKRIFQINVTDRESIDVFKEDILPILGQILSKK
ncbi:deoxynucleoside kinase [uncultured Tolumonas sp.]|uniref:deoxynucleoside kinase n=1 Tax=uncultured Tolumonas sp. TaxID=263765 RepID=UPI002A0A87E0|nr:deoxynucleoside kinase [uncultured Tolumonas sp.]